MKDSWKEIVELAEALRAVGVTQIKTAELELSLAPDHGERTEPRTNEDGDTERPRPAASPHIMGALDTLLSNGRKAAAHGQE